MKLDLAGNIYFSQCGKTFNHSIKHNSYVYYFLEENRLKLKLINKIRLGFLL